MTLIIVGGGEITHPKKCFSDFPISLIYELDRTFNKTKVCAKFQEIWIERMTAII